MVGPVTQGVAQSAQPWAGVSHPSRMPKRWVADRRAAVGFRCSAVGQCRNWWGSDEPVEPHGVNGSRGPACASHADRRLPQREIELRRGHGNRGVHSGHEVVGRGAGRSAAAFRAGMNGRAGYPGHCAERSALGWSLASLREAQAVGSHPAEVRRTKSE